MMKKRPTRGKLAVLKNQRVGWRTFELLPAFAEITSGAVLVQLLHTFCIRARRTILNF